jgi:hypothetical protein
MSRKSGRVGHKVTLIDLEPLRNVRINERISLEVVNNHLEISKSKMIRYMSQRTPQAPFKQHKTILN